jgi:hypothetical protein
LVIPTELEIFYRDFGGKALLLVIFTELEIFYQDFWFLFVERLPDALSERLSTVSSPYMVLLLSGIRSYLKEKLPKFLYLT